MPGNVEFTGASRVQGLIQQFESQSIEKGKTPEGRSVEAPPGPQLQQLAAKTEEAAAGKTPPPVSPSSTPSELKVSQNPQNPEQTRTKETFDQSMVSLSPQQSSSPSERWRSLSDTQLRSLGQGSRTLIGERRASIDFGTKNPLPPELSTRPRSQSTYRESPKAAEEGKTTEKFSEKAIGRFVKKKELYFEANKSKSGEISKSAKKEIAGQFGGLVGAIGKNEKQPTIQTLADLQKMEKDLQNQGILGKNGSSELRSLENKWSPGFRDSLAKFSELEKAPPAASFAKVNIGDIVQTKNKEDLKGDQMRASDFGQLFKAVQEASVNEKNYNTSLKEYRSALNSLVDQKMITKDDPLFEGLDDMIKSSDNMLVSLGQVKDPELAEEKFEVYNGNRVSRGRDTLISEANVDRLNQNLELYREGMSPSVLGPAAREAALGAARFPALQAHVKELNDKTGGKFGVAFQKASGKPDPSFYTSQPMQKTMRFSMPAEVVSQRAGAKNQAQANAIFSTAKQAGLLANELKAAIEDQGAQDTSVAGAA